MIKQSVTEKNRLLEVRTAKEYERKKVKAAKIENAIEYMTHRVLDVVDPRPKRVPVARAKSRPSHKISEEPVVKRKLTHKMGATKELEFFEDENANDMLIS